MELKKKQELNTSLIAYLSDFYYAIAIIILLIAAYFLFNEPTGVSMLSFDMSIMLVAFAIFYAAANSTGEQVLKFITKYMVLIGITVTCYQFMLDYSFLGVLQALFAVSIIILVVVFIFDFILYFKDMIEKIWDMFRGRTRKKG